MGIHYSQSAVMAIYSMDTTREALRAFARRLPEFPLPDDDNETLQERLTGVLADLDLLVLDLYGLYHATAGEAS